MAPRFVPLSFREHSQEEMLLRARAFREEMASRRSVRHFCDRPVPRAIVEEAIRTAGSAPSGAHKQPWSFVLVGDSEVKRRIRDAAEAEERENYGGRMPESWLRDLAPFGTDWQKPFLTTCPWLVVVFARMFEERPDGPPAKHYYVTESVGIATGFLLAALHHAGLATLTHTPSPMGFLRDVLGRPSAERPFLLVAAGYPDPDCVVPDITRKELAEILTVL